MTRFLMHGNIRKKGKKYLLELKQIILDNPFRPVTHVLSNDLCRKDDTIKEGVLSPLPQTPKDNLKSSGVISGRATSPSLKSKKNKVVTV